MEDTSTRTESNSAQIYVVRDITERRETMSECLNCDNKLGDRFFKAVMDRTRNFFVCSVQCGDDYMHKKDGKHLRMREVNMVDDVMQVYGEIGEDSEMSCDIGVANLEI